MTAVKAKNAIALLAHLDGPAQGAGLSPLLIETARARRADLAPPG